MVPVWLPRGRGSSPWHRVAAVWVWPIRWSRGGRRRGMVGSLVLVWPPWGRGPSLGPCVVAVGVWPVPWPCLSAVGRAHPLGLVWLTSGRGRFPWPRMVAVVAWIVFFLQYDRRGNVTRHLDPVWPPWGRGTSPGPRIAAVGRCPCSCFPMATVGAWPIHYASCGCRGGVACPLGLVWPPWGCGPSPGPREAAVGVWAFLWTTYGRRGEWPAPGPRIVAVNMWSVPLATYGRRGCVASPLGLVWPPWGRGPSPGPRMVAMGAFPIP